MIMAPISPHASSLPNRTAELVDLSPSPNLQQTLLVTIGKYLLFITLYLPSVCRTSIGTVTHSSLRVSNNLMLDLIYPTKTLSSSRVCPWTPILWNVTICPSSRFGFDTRPSSGSDFWPIWWIIWSNPLSVIRLLWSLPVRCPLNEGGCRLSLQTLHSWERHFGFCCQK